METRGTGPLRAKKEDERIIRGLYQQLLDGWNVGSGEIFAAPFAETADFVALDGTQLHKRREIQHFHQQLFDTFLRGTRLVGKVRCVRFLTPDAALMTAAGGMVMPGRTDLERERNSIQMLVAVRDASLGEWQLAAFQNTRAHYLGRSPADEALIAELRQEVQREL